MLTLVTALMVAALNLTPHGDVTLPIYPCGDGIPVYVAPDGTVYGDQNNNGTIDPAECLDT
ncbi:hypothetical protein AXJ10_gp94 [Gordonia phage GordTnk2]|uniref:Uncharacterized protein n=1 Tax=Gordonia phage GordTnk2 TaxID=1622192 RepID=A0A0E3T6J8_9CAUD|nr:hypothetical protein AXJ10_gp94 [Gordonia phage GordTnk2]AKC02834.1 hypothetical protein GordTnk2_94 [Gordonia phage GordTnk2]